MTTQFTQESIKKI